MNTDSKFLRHHFGIGMPEATGIVRITTSKTLKELLLFYFKSLKN
jgi:hypothetical protein